MENSYYPSTEQNVLDEFEVNLQQASAGKRFANYLIDVVCWMAVIFVGSIVYYSIVGIDQSGDGGSKDLMLQLIGTVSYIVLMALIEGLTRGKSLGKLITGTRVVNGDGSRISFKTALLRSLSRIVPFEPFSALGSPSYPWHDKWTHTYVVDEKTSSLPSQS